MRLKNQTRVGVVAVLVLMLTIWGSLAYYVANETAHNVISTGGVDVELVEFATNENGEVVPFNNLENLLPGETVSKIPQVKNLGQAPAYVRAKVNLTATLADGAVVEVPDGLIEANYNNEKWVMDEDGYFYYDEILDGAAITEKLFDTVTIAPELSNIYKDATFTMIVATEAVQAANNGTSALTATGWPEE